MLEVRCMKKQHCCKLVCLQDELMTGLRICFLNFGGLVPCVPLVVLLHEGLQFCRDGAASGVGLEDLLPHGLTSASSSSAMP